MGTIRTHYLDASAIVKLLIREPGSEDLCNYRRQYSIFRTTSLCFAETLSVLKAKHFYRSPKITQDEYLNACNLLMSYVRNEAISIEEVPINQLSVLAEVEGLVKKYSIDLSDAFQIYTLKKGFFSALKVDSGPWLITGDSTLATAAKTEGLKNVWNCSKDAPP